MGMMVNASLFDTGGAGMLNLVIDFNDELSEWNDYQLANPTSNTLFIPAGTHDAYGPDLTGTRGRLSRWGPGTQTIIGAGVSTTFVDNITEPFSKRAYYGSTGVNENGLLPKIDTMLVGEDVATLKVLADVSKFTVGEWVQVLAYDMQAFGYPINNHFFEYRQVTDVNVITGEITLDQGVRNDYKDTYPQINSGSPIFPDQCGPASLMPMNGPTIWNYHAHAKNLTINPTYTGAIYSEGREITWENCHFLHYGHIPSLSHTVNYINCEFDGFAGFEFDKSVELVNYENCICNDVITQQSSTIYELTMTDCAVNQLNGTAVHATLTDSTFTGLNIGCSAYGGAKSCTMDGCDVTNFNFYKNTFQFDTTGGAVTNAGGGVFTIAYSDAQSTDLFIRLIPDPGLWYYFNHPSFGRYGPPFQCTDVTFSGFPSAILSYTTTLSDTDPRLAICSVVTLHGMPSLTVTDTTGHAAFVSYPAAAGLPAGDYYNSGPWNPASFYYLAGVGNPRLSGVNVPPAGYMAGEIVSLTFTVTKAYTGGNANCQISLTGEFGFNGFPCVEADLVTAGEWLPIFDLMTLGTRVITPSGVTGGQPNDGGLAVGNNVWVRGYNGLVGNPRISSDISGEATSTWPEYEFELILDQGIP